MPAPLLVTYEPAAGVLHVAVDGEIDVANCPEVLAAVLAEVAARTPSQVHIDLDRSTFFGADGVRALFAMARAIEPPLRVSSTADTSARRVLDLFGDELREAGISLA